jgi:pimeloyl-ACP methyl ester carboxylesterase
MKTFARFLLCLLMSGACARAENDMSADLSSSGNSRGRGVGYYQTGSGGPVVVFENGLGGSWGVWKFVQEDVRQYAETFAYNRAGYKGTPQPDGARSASAIASELRTLLAERRLQPPYVLVGHSLGGLFVQYYARNFPEEVAGLVLVDSSHWDQTARMPRTGRSAIVSAVMTWILVWGAPADEADAFEITQREVRESPPLRPMPFTVLTAGLQGEVWKDLQRELAGQLPDAKHTIVEGSGHVMQQDQPERIAAAVRDMLVLLRGK